MTTEEEKVLLDGVREIIYSAIQTLISSSKGVLDEREACAQIAENAEPQKLNQSGYEWDSACEQIAAAIRARSYQPPPGA